MHLQTPSKRSLKGKKRAPSHGSEGGVSLELEYATVQPSPRRLRSKDREHGKSKVTDDPHATPVANSKRRSNARKSDPYDREDIEPRLLRVTPMRKAKDKIGNFVESNEVEEGEECEDSLEDGEDGEPVADEEDEEADEDQFDEPQEEDEVDELVSSASVSPPESQSLHISTKRRGLRPRRKHIKIVPTGDEGDDEEEEEQSDGGEGGEEEENAEEDVEEATLAVKPRKLRNGKIVSDVEEEMEVDRETIGSGDEEDNEGEELDDTESVGGSEISMDHDDETEEQVELMEEDGKDLITFVNLD